MSEFVMTIAEANMVYPQLDDAARKATLYDNDRLITQDQYDAQVQAAIDKFPQVQSGSLKDYAASVRYRKESAGQTIDVGGGLMVTATTTTASQSKISTAAQQAQLNPNFSAQWKQQDGSFVTLNATQLLRLNELVTNHVEACYGTEKECCDQIDAGAITTTDQIDELFAGAS